MYLSSQIPKSGQYSTLVPKDQKRKEIATCGKFVSPQQLL